MARPGKAPTIAHVIHTYNYSHNTSYYITSVRDGQPSRTTASVYVYSGLRLATSVGYAGLLRTMPDYFWTTSNYAGLLPVYSGQLGCTQGFSAPAPRANLDPGEATYFMSPLCRFSYIDGCRIRAGFPYVQWRGLLPTLVGDPSSQAIKS